MLSKSSMRRDAQERRSALIDAAAMCFAERGYGVPLEEIAEKAGVGRGTLYRNFTDRAALALAIFAREIDSLEANIDPDLPFEAMLAQLTRSGIHASKLLARIGGELSANAPNLAPFHDLRDRFTAVLAPMVAAAHARGELRSDIGAAEVATALRMIGGLLQPSLTPAEVEAQIALALKLLFAGLRPD